MDGSIVVFQFVRFQRSMAGRIMRQMAYDECQPGLAVDDLSVFVVMQMMHDIPHAKDQNGDCHTK